MIQFLFATLGAWVFWGSYIVINTILWAICMEHCDDMISDLANEEETDTGEIIFAAASWLFFPIILVLIVVIRTLRFAINRIVGPVSKKFFKALLKIIPKIEFNLKFKKDEQEPEEEKEKNICIPKKYASTDEYVQHLIQSAAKTGSVNRGTFEEREIWYEELLINRGFIDYLLKQWDKVDKARTAVLDVYANTLEVYKNALSNADSRALDIFMLEKVPNTELSGFGALTRIINMHEFLHRKSI